MKSWATAAAALGLALLSYFQFPGHTYLQQDTQIYVPILEHLRDPAILRNDILAQQPHVRFTLYDEIARSLRPVSGFHEVLAFQQIVTRALGIWGLYLIVLAMGLSPGPAALAAAIVSLGASIPGPAVLTWEYEPTPRAFAVPLLILGMGLAGHRRYFGAGVAAAAAFLYHPPTALPFWAVFAVVLVVRRQPRAALPLAAAVILLGIGAWAQAGEGQELFSRLTPLQEQLQRMRAPYVWISSWAGALLPHYLLASALLLLAFARVRLKIPMELRLALLGLPLLGMLSMPVSWLLLEHWKWALLPQVQPLRTLLFVALSFQILTAVAGIYAIHAGRLWEAAAWFGLAYLLPLDPVIKQPISWQRVGVLLTLALLTALAGRVEVRLALAVALAAFFAIPRIGGVANYPDLHTAELAQLSEWARTATSADAVFLFPDASHALYPGIFRSQALRAVYVDWKGGGQVNYLAEFGEQWWFRWQQTMAAGFRPQDLEKYGGLGVQYVVLQPRNRMMAPPVFENGSYLVYKVGFEAPGKAWNGAAGGSNVAFLTCV